MEVNSNKSIAVNRTSLQSVLTTIIGVNKRRQRDRYYNNTPTMRSRCQHTDQKGQVSMTEIDQWRNRSEYNTIMQQLERGDQKIKSAWDEVAKIIRYMAKYIISIRLGGRQNITQRENKTIQTLEEWSNISIRKLKYLKKAETDYLEKEMKRVCNTLLNNFGKMSNDEEENICRSGKVLLDRAMKLNKSRVSKSLMSWMEKTDKLMGRCRWIECRPKEKIMNEPARMSFQDNVMRQWDRMRQRQMNQPKSTGEGNKMEIISNIDDYRGIDIKAGDGDDDKTVIASNTWEEYAMYAGRDGHYEEFEQYDSWNDGYSRPDDEWDESWAENDPDPQMYEEQQ